jgi:hypothetical protein
MAIRRPRSSSSSTFICCARRMRFPLWEPRTSSSPVQLVLGALCWRQPFLQQVGGASLSLAAPSVRADTVVGSDFITLAAAVP